MKNNLFPLVFVFSLICSPLNLCFAAGGSQTIGLLQDGFSYSGWSSSPAPMDAIWTTVNGNTPTIITNNPTLAPTYINLSSGTISANLGRPLNADFQVTINVLQTQYQRWQWVGLFNAAGTQGYGFGWDSGVATQNNSGGAVSIRKFTSAPPPAFDLNYGTLLGSAVSSGHNPGNTTNAAISAPFARFQFTWHGATSQLTLSVDGVVVSTITDSSFASFSKIYISGDSSGLFANLTISVPGGATVPFTTIEAEAPGNVTTGTVVAFSGTPNSSTDSPELEASGRAYVALTATGQHLDFPVTAPANSLVIRQSIPDASSGGGTTATLSLYVNGVKRQTLTLSSLHNWLYGAIGTNGQSNSPSDGAPHAFWDESRYLITGAGLNAGDVLRLEKDSGDTAAFYHIDVIDLEQVAAPLGPPAAGTYLSVMSYGATGNGVTDDTSAIAACIAAAQAQNKIVWIPSGTYMVNSQFNINGVDVQGAGMWYTDLVGNNSSPTGTIGFNLTGQAPQVHDLFIDNAAETTNVFGGGGAIQSTTSMTGPSDFTVENVWITHARMGMWMANGSIGGSITGCRVRSTYCDGIHLNGGCQNNLVENNHIRGSGDDGLAILSRTTEPLISSGNTVAFNTVIATDWGLNCDVAGGSNEQIEYNYLADNTGDSCLGVNMPYSYGMNPLSSSMIDRNILVRGGGDFSGDQRPGFWIYPGCASVTSLVIEDNFITNSYFSGFDNTTSTYTQQITFEGNAILNSGIDGFHINSTPGSGSFINNYVSGVGPSPATAFQNNGGSGYTATQSGNSWQ